MDKNIKGININFLNTFLTVLTAIVFCFILLISNNVNRRFSDVQKTISKFIICEQSSKDIKESANYLTEQARLFVVTLNPIYANSYLKEIKETRTQEKALDELLKVCSEKDLALQRLKIALNQAESLTNMELYAIRLGYESIIKRQNKNIDIPELISKINIRPADKKLESDELQRTAINNLFGEGYLIYKTRINENCNITISSIELQIEDELGNNAARLGFSLNRLQILFCILLIVNIMIFVALAILVILPLKTFQYSIQKDEKLKIIGSTEFKNLAYSYNEIYEIKARNERSLLIQAEYDSLTGILNRRAFDQICQTSSEKKQSIALLLIDMDNFKHINDTYGHSGGDTVLKEVARILGITFRKDDYIARIGGDEFAAILQDFKPESTAIIIEKIREVNEQLVYMKEDIKSVSISVGVAYSMTGYSEELYNQADKALYYVKENGRCGCKIYEESLEDISKIELSDILD